MSEQTNNRINHLNDRCSDLHTRVMRLEDSPTVEGKDDDLGKRRITVYLPADLAKSLRMRAVEDEVSISDVVEQAIAALLSGESGDILYLHNRQVFASNLIKRALDAMNGVKGE